MKIQRSEELFQNAKKTIPGGVNSPVRAFKAVGGNPLFMVSGNGSKMTDADGNTFIDYIGSWGPHLFGHNPRFIIDAVRQQLEQGVSFGAPTELEIIMANLIVELVPAVEMVRMVNSGTEATMSAIRVARGFTGRDKIIKFEGCYHGHADYFLIKAGSGALTLGVPTSPGVTKGTAADTLTAQINDIESIKELFSAHPGQIAAVIIEPIAGNMGVVPPKPGYLEALRELTQQEGALLIFDEVMTGFRVAKGGAAELYGITPDLLTFGKIIGGGLPVGAFGGKREVMEKVAPAGPVYQAGTLSGNPLAMSAGIAALTYIKNNPGLYSELEQKAEYLEAGFKENHKKLGRNYSMNRVGSMSCLFFTDKEVTDFKTALTSDTAAYGRYFQEMLKRGVYLAPAQFEAMFLSTVHNREDLDLTIQAHYESLKFL
ncbi:glutamate-1-semialdehyde 2,1-aminomutase [uncultured bacterium]|nr:glutamate-1-semialdehyde 2,1-aminomutase [uncultured bacterium]